MGLEAMKKIVLTALLALAHAGCGAASTRPSCDLPESGNLTVEGTDRVNPDTQGTSLPTIVRVFQLNSLGSLETASFDEMWRSPEDTLGDTLISMDEFTYYPNPPDERQPVVRRTFERDPAANFIVGMAIVRRPAGVSWRSVLELPVPASATACAAQQVDPEAPPPAPEVVEVRFELDDYRIEGFLTLTAPPASCEPGDLPCLRDAARAEEPDPEAAEAAEAAEATPTEAPTIPGS